MCRLRTARQTPILVGYGGRRNLISALCNPNIPFFLDKACRVTPYHPSPTETVDGCCRSLSCSSFSVIITYVVIDFADVCKPYRINSSYLTSWHYYCINCGLVHKNDILNT